MLLQPEKLQLYKANNMCDTFWYGKHSLAATLLQGYCFAYVKNFLIVQIRHITAFNHGVKSRSRKQKQKRKGRIEFSENMNKAKF